MGSHRWIVGSLVSVLVALGCAPAGGPGAGSTGGGSGDAGPEEPPPPDFDLETPRLESVTPTRVQLGDRMRVFGERFLDTEHGQLVLQLEGRYITQKGEAHDYEGEVALTHENPSMASFTLDRLFVTTDEVGSFHGSGRVINRLETDARNAPAGSERSSSWSAIAIDILPSIEIVELHSIERDDCADRTSGTTVSSRLALGIKAVGFGEATPDDPILFRVGFDSREFEVQYVKNDVYRAWPLTQLGALESSVVTDAPDGQSTMTFRIEEGNTLRLDPSWRQTVAQVSPPVRIGQESHPEVILGRLAAGSIEHGQGPLRSTLHLEAERAGGPRAERSAGLDVWNQWEALPYDGNQRLVERFPAEVPPGQCGSCIPGGDLAGRELSYTEGETASQTRSLSVRWDVSVANSLGIMYMRGPFIPWQIGGNFQTTLTSSFGVDVSESVTSEKHRTLNINAHIIPSYYGICYRQLSKYEREVGVRYHNTCGAEGVVGKAVLTDWGWGFDVAQGPQCQPPTNLPAPYKAPEDGSSQPPETEIPI